jgi:hypothetical protein
MRQAPYNEVNIHSVKLGKPLARLEAFHGLQDVSRPDVLKEPPSRTGFQKFLMRPSLTMVRKVPLVDNSELTCKSASGGTLAALVLCHAAVKIVRHAHIDRATFESKCVNPDFTHDRAQKEKLERAKGFEPSTFTLAT